MALKINVLYFQQQL